MIVCPNCNHQNPDGAIQCEACYTPLPAMLECPACGASVQSDASFCGQCGANLATNPPQGGGSVSPPISVEGESGISASIAKPAPTLDLPDVEIPDLVEPDALEVSEPLVAIPDPPSPPSPIPSAEAAGTAATPDPALAAAAPDENQPAMVSATAQSSAPAPPAFQSTQLQTQTVRLIHTQTNAPLELPPHLAVIHVGKPNDRVPPDIDVSGFVDSEVVSRVHADIRVEGDQYYLEDVGSSNGTYVNNVPLLPGNRHRLRTGDRIALGKGDKVSFIVEIS
ncbi:MAG: FHA domain-containing protein [Cyanothece sp. SIO2G6]|nr:FHA domain-containing protein [Cyanothece sp. SIO2G6]